MATPDTVVCCPTCGLLQRIPPQEQGLACECTRCGSFLTARRSAGSLHVTAAFSLAALILYVPANLYPILSMNLYGAYNESTVWDGVVSLARSDEWLVAVVVFLASIAIPLFKLTGLFFLVASVKRRMRRWRLARTRIYRFIDVIGPWAMLDVFLLAILVALVKLGSLASVMPGPGLLPFTCVVVLTILASESFDPRRIWEGSE